MLTSTNRNIPKTLVYFLVLSCIFHIICIRLRFTKLTAVLFEAERQCCGGYRGNTQVVGNAQKIVCLNLFIVCITSCYGIWLTGEIYEYIFNESVWKT